MGDRPVLAIVGGGMPVDSLTVARMIEHSKANVFAIDHDKIQGLSADEIMLDEWEEFVAYCENEAGLIDAVKEEIKIIAAGYDFDEKPVDISPKTGYTAPKGYQGFQKNRKKGKGRRY